MSSSLATSDFVVIGSGPGGYQAALRAAHHGASVTLIEERHLGGVCLNRGCIPTKGTVTSIEVLRLARHAAEYGIDVPEAAFQLEKIVDRRNAVVTKIQQGLRFLLERSKVKVVQARGRLAGDHVVEAGGTRIKGRTILLATGSHPAALPIAKPDGKLILNSDHSLEVREVPGSMIILGGGYIGCEYAAIFSQLGTQVTVIELMDRLLPLMDADLGRQLERSFKKQGVSVRTGEKVESIVADGGRVRAKFVTGESVEADKLLVSVGRLPNTEGLGLENENIRSDPYVVVDEHMLTSAPGIYALGDIVGKFPLAHVASAQARVAVNHALGVADSMDYRVVPSAVFTYPELASVGMSEEEARKAGSAKSAKFPLAALGKPISQGEPEGFVKIVGDEKTGELLGAHLAGLHAAEIIGTLAVAMQARMKITELAKTIFTHPTYSEAIPEACELWLGQAVHLPPLRRQPGT